MLENQGKVVDWDSYTNRKIKHAEPTQLSHENWMMIYSENDDRRANNCFDNLQKASGAFGIKVEEPFWCEVDGKLSQKRDGYGFVDHLQKDGGFPFKKFRLAIVIIRNPRDKKAIKKLLDTKGIVSQFILANTIDRAKITVYSNVLK